MSVHYKFKSSLDFDTVTFDGLHISVSDLKKSILQQKKIGKAADFDLQITNAQTKEVYTADDVLIPKNTSVIISRVPVTSTGRKNWERNRDGDHSQQDVNSPSRNYEKLSKTADLVNAKATEEDKIKAMMTQSSQEYDPSKYVKSRSMTGPLPPNYTCFRCGKSGHWIKNCPTNNIEVKRSTGIPRSFMVTVDGPDHKGALLTSTGEFAVPLIDHEAYKEVKKEKPPFVKEPTPEPTQEPQLPDELLCMICRDLLQDAVLIPCCGNSFCDECVRQALLDSEQHECPVCHECDISPNNLIPNRFLRTAVLNFKNETGYTRAKRAHVALPPPLSVVAGSSSPSIAGTSESSATATAAASMSPAAVGSALTVPGTTSGSASPVADARSPAAEEKGETKEDGEKSSPAPAADDAAEVSKEGEAADAEPRKESGYRSPTGSVPDNPPGTPLADERPEEPPGVSLDEALTMSPQQRERGEDSDDGRRRSSSSSRRHRSPSSRGLDNGGGDSVCAIATITTRVPNYAGMPVNLPGRSGRDSGLDSPRGSGRGPPLHRSSRHGDYGDHRRSRHDYGPGNSLRTADYRGAPLYPQYGQAMTGGGFHAPPPMHMPPVPPPQGHLPPPSLPPPPFPGQAPPPGMTAAPLGPPHYPMTTSASYINPAKPFGADDYHARRRSRRAGDPLEEFEKHLRDLHRNRRGGREGGRRRSHSKTRSRSSSYSRSRSKSRPRSGGSRSYSPRSYSRSPRSPSRYSASSRSYSRSRSRSYSRSRSRSRSGAHRGGGGGRGSRSRSPSAGAAPRRASPKSPRARRSRSGSYRSSRSPARSSQQRRGRHYHSKSRRPYARSRSPRSPRSYHHHPLPPPPPIAGVYRGGRSPPPPPPPPPHFRGHRRGPGHFFGGYPPGGYPPEHMGMPVEFDERHYFHHHHDGGGGSGFRFPGFQGGPPPPHHDMRDRRYDPGVPMARFHGERPPRSSRADYAPPDAIAAAEAEALKGRDAREGRGREYSYRRSDAITTPLVVREGEGKERKGGGSPLDTEAKALKKRLKEKEREDKLKHKHHHKAKEPKKEVVEVVLKKTKAKAEPAAQPPADPVPTEVAPAEGTPLKVEKEVAAELAPEAAAKEKKHKHKKKLKLQEEAAALRKAARTSDDSTSQLPPGAEDELVKRKKKKKKLKDSKLQEKGLIQQMMEVAQSRAALQAAKAAKQLALQQLPTVAKQEVVVGSTEELRAAPGAPEKTLQAEEKLLKPEDKSWQGTEAELASKEKGAEEVPPAKPELQVELPELSKWEREDLEEEGQLSPVRKPPVEEAKESKPTLSSEVIMRAENVLLHKPLKTAIVAASSIRSTGEKKVKSAPPVEASASAPPRSTEPLHATAESSPRGEERGVEPPREDKPSQVVELPPVREVKEGRREVSVPSRLRDRLDGTLQVTITSDKERRSVLTPTDREQRSLAEGQLKRIKLDRSKFSDKMLRGESEMSQGGLPSDSSKPPRSSSRREDRDRKPDDRSSDRRPEDHRPDDRRLPPEMGGHDGRVRGTREDRSQRERGSSSRSSHRLREGSLRSGGRDGHRGGQDHRSRTPDGDRSRRRKEDRYYGMPPEERLRRSYEEGRREMMAEAEHDRRQLMAAEEHRRFLLEELERQQHRGHHDHRRSRMDPGLRFRLEEREMEERRFAAAARRMDWPPPLLMTAPQSQQQSKGDKLERSHHHHHHQPERDRERVASFAVPSAASVPTQQKTERSAVAELRGRKESTQDESRFEPDYDELIEEDDSAQRSKRKSVSTPVESEAVVPVKKPKVDVEQESANPMAPSASATEEAVVAAVAEEKSSSSSSDSSEDEDKQLHKKHKKKHKKHKKHKHKHKKKKKSKKAEKSD
ncbi:E3 ubiquitin-protein ligase RBBP6 isoform X2 [Ixodes scapularis]|uniref:E3 ubiquitin-protein ligase RBBP6 isoform X2 n=1 Tax=Ixodes scapularis TaxID=6945 RepID=UPI001A9F3C29|nr:E3 ubiquitin-protein ligase RBBP6 isoform X2 [Ixodes scapularis]